MFGAPEENACIYAAPAYNTKMSMGLRRSTVTSTSLGWATVVQWCWSFMLMIKANAAPGLGAAQVLVFQYDGARVRGPYPPTLPVAMRKP